MNKRDDDVDSATPSESSSSEDADSPPTNATRVTSQVFDKPLTVEPAEAESLWDGRFLVFLVLCLSAMVLSGMIALPKLAHESSMDSNDRINTSIDMTIEKSEMVTVSSICILIYCPFLHEAFVA